MKKKVELYFKTDFQVILESETGWTVPFRLLFWTNAPTRGFVCSFDGENYTNCHLQEDGRLCIGFDDHKLGLGELMLQPTFYLDNECYKSGICDEAISPYAPEFIELDEEGEPTGNTYTVQLCLSGSKTLTTIGTLPSFYQKGPKGDKGDKGDTGATGPQGPTGPTGASTIMAAEVNADGDLIITENNDGTVEFALDGVNLVITF